MVNNGKIVEGVTLQTLTDNWVQVRSIHHSPFTIHVFSPFTIHVQGAQSWQT